MKLLNDNELKNINGGSISGTLINSIVRAVNVIIDLGRALGTAIRRISEDKMCKI
jgi:bacteriocin-like protein